MTTVTASKTFAPRLGVYGNSFAPQEKPTKQIVREEIQRQKKLDKLEEQYKNGEISKLDYNVQKAILNMPVVFDKATEYTVCYQV
ncbi:MAG: hypothetical protein IJY61_06675 [Candidatus Gastranaerophilales bacterium]|nr:hypothetical protein [Candidatus Gastranaerophilales bacterium]